MEQENNNDNILLLSTEDISKMNFAELFLYIEQLNKLEVAITEDSKESDTHE